MLRRYGPFWLCSGVIAALSFGSAVLPSGLRAARQESSRPPTSVQQALAPEAIEWALFESINKERAARNLPALRLSPPLSEVARKHSAEMARLGRLAHESASGGTLTNRLDEARIPNVLNAENVARSTSPYPALIHEALMKSGGHRENILLPDVDEVGIGVVCGPGGDNYVTQDFIRSVAWLDDGAARAAVLRALDEARRRRGLAPLQVHDEITRTAQAFALLKAEGKTAPPVPAEFGETRVEFHAGPDLTKITALIRELPVERFRMTGVGVHIAPTSAHPAGAYQICTFLLVGNPALSWTEDQRVKAVLQTVNAVRAGRNMGPFEIDTGLSRKAGDIAGRYRKNRSKAGDPRLDIPLILLGDDRPRRRDHQQRLWGPADVGVITVVYETSELDRLALNLHDHVTGRGARKVGISVTPATAGLTVNFVVILLLED
jgi:uncharacterized protein YkwD